MFVLTIIFIFSGAAGLVYESVWSRYLGLFVGHSAYAQVIVLVIFLGGMSLGAFIAGEWSTRLARPLRQYAYVELAVGGLGLLFHYGYAQVTGLAHDGLFPALAASGAVSYAKWGIAALLILPQSLLLGTTFPLMVTGAVRLYPDRPGRDLSLLYFGNSFGAAIGVLFAGFVLLRLGGLPGTLMAAGIINVAVAAAALVADRSLQPRSAGAVIAPTNPKPARRGAKVSRAERKRKARARAAVDTAVARRSFIGEPDPSEDPAALPLALVRPSQSTLRRIAPVLLAVSFGTAVASFIYEIAWIRMLSLVLGSATHAFELMLSAFILGLALGSYAIRSWVDRFTHPIFVLGVVQWAMGLLALATLPLYVASFHWAAWLHDALLGSTYGYEGYVITRYALCLVIMLPATFLAGMTLPLITRTLLVAGAGERAIGRVYAANTLGAIVGVLLAAIVLMPVLGLRMLLATGAVADMAIGAALLWPVVRKPFLLRPKPIFAALGLSVAFVAVTLLFVRLDKAVLTGGVYRRGADAIRERAEILFYRDGRTATISVRRTPESGLITLATNGKPDASLGPFWLHPTSGATKLPLAGDQGTQVLLPIMTLAHAPRARTAAVIGQGSGVSSHFLLGSPHLTTVATIEIEPEVISASRAFYPFNRRVFDDSRSALVVDDAKSYFATQQRQFDLIMSEPSNPWVSGVSGLFTVEFYRQARRHLTPGGVFGQWLHLYQTTDDMVMSVLAALDQVFGDYEIFTVAPGDILIVATSGNTLPAPDWGVLDFPAIRDDLSRALTPSQPAFERMRIAGSGVIRPMLRGVKPNSDFHPFLDLAAERARFTRSGAQGFYSLTEQWFDLPAVLQGRRLGFTTDTASVAPGIPRVDQAAFGARLRNARDGEAGQEPTAEPADARLREALSRLAALEQSVASGKAPPDWRMWLLAVVRTERELHGGTSGVADDDFYGKILSFARENGAPEELVAVLLVLRGMRTWEFEAVLRHAPMLERAHRSGQPWIPPELLRDGTVAGYLVSGDTLRAGERLEALTALSTATDPGYQYRTRLLRSVSGRLAQ